MHIVIKKQDVPDLIKKLYRLVNLPDVCVVDKTQKAEYVIINTSKEKVISIHKLCKNHEHKRRKLLWLRHFNSMSQTSKSQKGRIEIKWRKGKQD